MPVPAPVTASRPVAAAPPPRAPRVTLANVKKSANAAPLRVLLHGVEGVGKTTFGALAPSAVILGPEDGIPRELGEVPHFPVPEGGWTWPDVVDAVRALAAGDHDFKTVVIDTLDWLEPLLWRDVCERAGVTSIEQVGATDGKSGYGKGYVAALDGWRSFIAELEQLRRAKGMHIVLLAHSMIRTFKNPTGEDYDRFELKLNAKAAGLWKEWPDAVLFAAHDDVASKDTRTKRVRGVSTGARVMRTVHNAAFDAKNRFGLPEEMSLSWSEFYAAVEAGPAARVAELRSAIDALLKEAPEGLARTAGGVVERAGSNIAKLVEAQNWIVQKLEQLQTQQKGA